MHPGPAVGAIGPNEVDYLHYFREHAATTLSGPDNSTFWANVLCTASQKEPSIRYAIVALSSIHRHYAVSSEPTSSPDIALIKPQVTLTYYNAAISALSDITSAGPYSFVTSLMCCVIFIALETIQGNDAAVANHARSRQSVIRQWKTERHNGRRSSASMADYNDYCLVEQHIAPLVEQAAALTGCFQETGLGEVGSYLPDPGNYISFGSLLEAARALNDLGEVAVACNGPDAVAKLPGTGAIRDPPHIQQLQRQLRAWKVAYNDLHACMQAALATDARQASLADVLATNFYAIFVWLSSALAPDQSGFSEHYQTFQEITQFAPPIPTTSPPNHSWSESTMQQYVFAAFFCRDLQIRRQALRLLRRSLKGEAFPNLVLTLPICDRMAVSKIDTTSADPALDRYAVDFGHPQAEGASSGLGSIHQQLLHESSDHSNHDSRSPITACIPSLDITAPSLAPDYTPTHFAAQSSQDVIPYQSNFEVLDSLVQPATLSDSWCPQIAHGGFGETYLAAMFTSD